MRVRHGLRNFAAMRMRAIIASLLLAFAARAGEFKPTGFHLYYGSEPKMLSVLRGQLAQGHVAVVDPRALTHAQRQTLLDRANAVGAKVLAYVSIGELHDREASDFAAFFKASKQGESHANECVSHPLGVP